MHTVKNFDTIFIIICILFKNCNCEPGLNETVEVFNVSNEHKLSSFESTFSPEVTKIHGCFSNNKTTKESWNVPKSLQTTMSFQKLEHLRMRSEALYKFEIQDEGFTCKRIPELFHIELDHTLGVLNPAENPKFYWTPEGHLKTSLNEFISPDCYCINRIAETFVTVQVCPADENEGDLILNKCCPMGMVVQLNLSDISEKFECVETLYEDWSPILYSSQDYKKRSGSDERPNFVIANRNRTQAFHYLTPHKNAPSQIQAKIRILDNGEVQYFSRGDFKWYSLEWNVDDEGFINEVCVDGLVNINQNFTNTPENQIVMYTQTTVVEIEDDLEEAIVTLLVECVGFALYLLASVIYLLLWKQLNVHGWTRGAFVFSSCFMWLHLVVVDTVNHFLSTGRLTSNGSKVFLFFDICAAYFVVPLYISWMTIMNLDIWLTIRSNIARAGYFQSKGKKTFLIYCGSSLIIPFLAVLFVSICLPPISNDVDGNDKIEKMMKRLNEASIWFMIFLIFPLVFGCLTLKSLYEKNKQTTIVRKDNRKWLMKQTIIVLKVSFMAGIWFVFSVCWEYFCEKLFPKSYMVSVVGDLLLHISVFWTLVCNDDTRAKLSNKYRFFEEMFNFLESASSTCSCWNKLNVQKRKSPNASEVPKVAGTSESCKWYIGPEDLSVDMLSF